jgi:outer membrane lipoprotein-sorting protein
MRHLAALSLSLVLLTGQAFAGQMPSQAPIQFGAADKADLERVGAYLNGIHTLAGEFIQVGPDGQLDQGRFYIAKPGKMRFEYRPPNPILIVSDGTTVAVQNKKLKTVDRYPLSQTPLDLILSDDIDLVHSGAVMAVHREPGVLTVEARSSKNRSTSNLSLVFSAPDLELRQWTVTDDQGLQTTVSFDNLQPGAEIPPWLFVLEDAKAVGSKPRN